MMRTKNALSFCLVLATLFLAGRARALPKVAILAASPGGADVQAKLVGTGAFGSVDLINVSSSTPSAAYLQAYDAVAVFSSSPFASPTGMGDNLATYLEAGGGVLLFDYEALEQGAIGLAGRFVSTYTLMTTQSPNTIPSLASSIGTILDPNSALVSNVHTFGCKGKVCHRLSSALKNNATVVAKWGDGNPLVLRGSVGGHALAELNFYPVSDAVGGGEWDVNTDGATLMKNALLYVIPSALKATKSMQAFPDTPLAQSSSIVVSFTNTGAVPLTMTSAGITGVNAMDFTPLSSTTLPRAIQPGATLDVAVYFSPTALGPRTGILSATVTGAPTTVDSSLSGNAVAINFGVTPATVVSFGGTAVGKTLKKTFTLTNNTMQKIVMASSSVTLNAGEFTGDPSFMLPVTLPAGAAIDFNPTFTPGSPGVHFGTVTVVLGDGSSFVVPMNGSAGNAAIALGNNGVIFGSTHIGAASAQQPLTINNSGYADLHVFTITVSGVNAADFSAVAAMLPVTIAPGAVYTYLTSFRPMAAGQRSASITVTCDDPNAGTGTFNVSGTGVAFAESVAPGMLDFAMVKVGAMSMPQMVTLSNTSKAQLTVKKVLVTGPQAGSFALVKPPAANTIVPAGATLAVSVLYAPNVAAPASATLTFLLDDPNSPSLTVPLLGQGTAGAISVKPLSMNFGGIPVGSTSNPQDVTLSNSGGAPLTISALTFSDMAYSSTLPPMLPATVMPGASLAFPVVFMPAAHGVSTASLSIVSDDPIAAMTQIPLAGAGTQATLSVTPTSINFGVTLVGAPTDAVPVTISNIGDQAVSISTIAVSGGASFKLENNMAPLVLDPGSAVNVNVRYAPVSAGAASAMLVVTSKDMGVMPANVALSGVAVTTAVSLAPLQLDFGPVGVGTTSVGAAITIANTSGATITMTPPKSTSPQFVVDSTATQLTLPSGKTTTFLVSFAPMVVDNANGTVDIALASAPTKSIGSVVVTGQGIMAMPQSTPGKGGCSVGHRVSPAELAPLIALAALLVGRRRRRR